MAYTSKYKKIITDETPQAANPGLAFRITVEQYQDLLHHTHRASDIVADDGTSIGSDIDAVNSSVAELKSAIDANSEADAANLEAVNSALDNLKSALEQNTQADAQQVEAAAAAIEELKGLISANSDAIAENGEADEADTAAMNEALEAIRALIQANTDNDDANLASVTESISTLTALIAENSEADEEKAAEIASSLNELNAMIQANTDRANTINGSIEVLSAKVQTNTDNIATTGEDVEAIKAENAVLTEELAKMQAKFRQIMDNMTVTPKTTLPEPDENGVITLDWDYAASLAVAEGETVTLDLNGYNLTAADGCTLVNKGNLTIKGDGVVATTAAKSAAIANFPGASVTVEGGTFQSASWYTIKNLGVMVLEGDACITTTDDSNVSSLIDNGWYNNTDTVAGEAVDSQAGKASLTINGGKFSCTGGAKSCSVVKNDDNGTLVINGGTFDSTANTGASNAATILNWNVATINGGKFVGQYPISNGYYGEADVGQMVINDGEFIGSSTLFGQNGGATSNMGKVTITGGKYTAPAVGSANFTYAIEVTGGTFSSDMSAYIADHDKYECVANEDGTYTVQEKAV